MESFLTQTDQIFAVDSITENIISSLNFFFHISDDNCKPVALYWVWLTISRDNPIDYILLTALTLS